MAQPINYYIQLSDEFSTAIDGMTTLSLLDLANICTSMALDTIRNKYDFMHPLPNDSIWEETITLCIDGNLCCWFTVKQLMQLAHGLLAKAV